MRKIITSVLGILIVAGAFFWSKKISKQKQTPKPKTEKLVTSIYAQTVKNTSTPIIISTSGNLMAKNRIELFSEVQGIFESTGRDFLPGEYYKKGSVLLKINSQEHRANIRSSKSTLYNQIVSFLPDLRLDYPEAFPQWEQYVQNFSVEQPLKAFPVPTSDKEKLFIAGRNIQTTYYNIKNLEERLAKFTIYAPFSGTLTQATVRRGALVRAGQKLGEFINPNVYELELAVNSTYADLLKVGKIVNLHNVEKTQKWQGKVVRVNSLVDPASQTIPVFISVSGKGLREGMFLEAEVTAKEEANTFEIARKLLFDENKLFVVQDSTLGIAEVNPVFYKENTVVVKGLEDGTKVLAKAIPGAHSGMKIKVLE